MPKRDPAQPAGCKGTPTSQAEERKKNHNCTSRCPMVCAKTKGFDWPLEQVELAGRLGALSPFRREPESACVPGSSAAAPATTDKMRKRT